MDVWNLRGRAEAGGDELLLGGLDERVQVEHDHPVLDRDRRRLAGQHGVRLVMGDLQGAVPGRDELRARHQLLHFPMDEVGDAGDERAGQVVQAIHQLRPHALRGKGIDRVVGEPLDVHIGENLGGDPVGERRLDGRILDHGTHGGDEPVGLRDLVVRPDREHRGRDAHAPQDQEDGRGERLPPNPVTARRGGSAHRRHLVAQAFQLTPLVLVEHGGGSDGDMRAFVDVGHGRSLADMRRPNLRCLIGCGHRGSLGRSHRHPPVQKDARPNGLLAVEAPR